MAFNIGDGKELAKQRIAFEKEGAHLKKTGEPNESPERPFMGD